MINQRLRIVISLTIAFLAVNIYGRLSSSPYITKKTIESTKKFLASVKMPSMNLSSLFTLKFSPNTDSFKNNQNAFYLPSIAPKPTLPAVVLTEADPTGFNQIEPTNGMNPTSPIINITKANPTSIPKPTKAPKPTPTPKLPPISSAQRPGNTLTEIFQEVSQRECIPAALLHAFQTEESGAWWSTNDSSSKVKIYNKYGWWLDGSGSSCTGMGYHTATGVVPGDAVDAGSVCQNALGGYDQGIMGIIQISQFEEDAAKKYITSIIKGKIDRRVLFDNAVIFAIITKNRLGTPPTSCTDWPADAIKTAAEKHQGSCGNNYCADVLKYYKQYK